MKADKIEVFNNDIFFIIYPQEKKVEINNDIFDISINKIKLLIKIISTWSSDLDKRYFDGNKYSIRFYYNNHVDEIIGVRKLPDNYLEFDALVRDIYDRR